jgi:hypothetical protein
MVLYNADYAYKSIQLNSMLCNAIELNAVNSIKLNSVH